MLTKLFFLIVLLSQLLSCQKKNNDKNLYIVQADIRFGTKYFSIYLNEEGKSYVVKGKSSFYAEPFKAISFDTSDEFKLDSSKIFFENLKRIKNNPIILIDHLDAPRAEIYYNNRKIYDSHNWDSTFWGLFRPIMEQIPQGYNPFRLSDNPFD